MKPFDTQVEEETFLLQRCIAQQRSRRRGQGDVALVGSSRIDQYLTIRDACTAALSMSVQNAHEQFLEEREQEADEDEDSDASLTPRSTPRGSVDLSARRKSTASRRQSVASTRPRSKSAFKESGFLPTNRQSISLAGSNNMAAFTVVQQLEDDQQRLETARSHAVATLDGLRRDMCILLGHDGRSGADFLRKIKEEDMHHRGGFLSRRIVTMRKKQRRTREICVQELSSLKYLKRSARKEMQKCVTDWKGLAEEEGKSVQEVVSVGDEKTVQKGWKKLHKMQETLLHELASGLQSMFPADTTIRIMADAQTGLIEKLRDAFALVTVSNRGAEDAVR
eukprot:TRINITY_DN9694_c0_g1_i4.p1 TRINITY_DN9694_c0_g1~~TRINITY_DN9694_c0_g1_i4.p1  ORF type:complete len:337 (+),score=82.86 TRINITY_DN9694_c0_g1_i4:1056-2066(+)